MKTSTLFAATLATILSGILWAQTVGDEVIVAEPAEGDQYIAGRDVQVRAEISGDLVAAGQTVTVSGAVTDDLIVAGETLTLSGAIGDDLRAAGRQVNIASSIEGHTVAAGQSVTLTPQARVGDWAWLAGERIDIGGQVTGEVRAAGRRIRVDGRIDGDLRTFGRHVEIGPGAVIGGDLVWTGDHAPKIADSAEIRGKVVEEPKPAHERAREAFAPGLGAAVVLLLSLWVGALVIALLFPRLARQSTQTALGRPWACLGSGLVVLAVGPLLITLLLASVIGHLLAIGLLGGYIMILVLGGFTGLLILSSGILRGLGRQEKVGALYHALILAVAIVVLMLIQLVPIVGPMAALLTLLLGLGSLAVLGARQWTVKR